MTELEFIASLSPEEQLKKLDTKREQLVREIAASKIEAVENKYGRMKGIWMRVTDEKYREVIPFMILINISELGLQGMSVTTIGDAADEEFGLIVQNDYYLDTRLLDTAEESDADEVIEYIREFYKTRVENSLKSTIDDISLIL